MITRKLRSPTFCLDHAPHYSSTWGWVEGKTAITLTSLRPEDLPVLVVAPKRVAENVWEEERDLWRPDLSLCVATGGPEPRADALASDADIVVIGRDNIADALPMAKKWTTFVCDELSSFKTHDSNRSRVALKISKVIPRFIGLTGTPAPNGLLDLWHQVKLIDGGERLGTGITKYRHRYFTAGWSLPNGVVTYWDIRPGAAHRIHELVSDICLSMTSEGRVDLPEKIINRVEVPLNAKAKRVYKEMKKEYVVTQEILGAVHTASNAAVLSGKLRQVSAGFLYHDDNDLFSPEQERYERFSLEKIKALQEIIDGTGAPVLVFYQFEAERDAILANIKGPIATLDDEDAIKRWNRGETPVLIAHPKSAGHGLNLQYGGSAVVWTSPTWDLEEWDQGNKRLHRQGQRNNVVIHVLVSPGTLDGGMLDVLEGKTSVQGALMDHLESPI